MAPPQPFNVRLHNGLCDVAVSAINEIDIRGRLLDNLRGKDQRSTCIIGEEKSVAYRLAHKRIQTHPLQ